MRPTTLEELAEAVREAKNLRITGTGTKAAFAVPFEAEAELVVSGFSGIVEHDPGDQVVTVRAGTTLEELQAELRKSNLCLPFPAPERYGDLLAGFPGTVGGLVSMNLPHGLYGQVGGAREWVLGMTVVRASGVVAKSGSRVVKSVAGFDAHRLFIGARGTLGVVAEVSLRTYPVRALLRPQAVTVREWAPDRPLWVQRTLRTNFAQARDLAGDSLLASDEPSCTIWADSPSLPRLPEDWVLQANCGAENLRFHDEPFTEIMQRAKQLFDPTRKLNPGALGVL